MFSGGSCDFFYEFVVDFEDARIADPSLHLRHRFEYGDRGNRWTVLEI